MNQDHGEAKDVSDPVVDFSNCDLEPIHIPSAIQPHGVLVAARASDLRIAYVSENTEPLLQLRPAEVLERTLPELLGEQTARMIQESIEGEPALASNVLTATLPASGATLFDILAHRSETFIYVELEPAAGDRSWDLLAAGIQDSIHKLRRHATADGLWEAAARQVRRHTGYDRVMVYRFNEEGHGEVIAEDCEESMEPYLGLRYPATDIPQQARRLYLLQRMRMIADATYSPVRLLGHPVLAPEQPLDMTYCNLRSVSPMHLEYLRNMGVRASLAMSLVHKNTLWGMIVCHHRTPKCTPAEVRGLCDLLGQILSLLIEVTNQTDEYRERVTQQDMLAKLGETLAREESVTTSLASQATALLALTAADGLYLRLGGQTRLLGQTPSLEESAGLMTACRERMTEGVMVTDEVGKVFPAFAYLAEVASGLLMVQVPGDPHSGLLWFRQEVTRTVRWGGDPKEAHQNGLDQQGRVIVSPRRSFALWEEIQRGRSRPWQPLEIDGACSLQRLITSTLLHKTEARLSQLSYYDPLTSLPNRRVLTERLDAWRSSGATSPATLLFLDLDNFKLVNDSLGHLVGDELLRQIGRRLGLCAGNRHLVARLGGDEFVIFCEETPIAAAEELAAAILKSFTDPFVIEGKPFRTTVSIGIAPVNQLAPADKRDDLNYFDKAEPLRAADLAMYTAKKRGGNQLTVSETPQHETVLRQLHLEQGLFQALERREFSLAYQAQLAAATGQLTGFEALLRWDQPLYGRIPPIDFIPIAEKSGQIVPIGSWVLDQALAQLRTWRTRFGAALTMSVNVSPQQVCRPDFRHLVQNALDRVGLPATALHLEVTESILMQDTAVVHLEQVRAMGVRISVDDFGTGYSSLAYLQRLPIDEVKIDKSLLDQIVKSPRAMALFESIIHMAHAMEMTVIAEGVETREQWEKLKSVACDGAQGFFLSQPLAAIEVEQRFTAQAEVPFYPGMAAVAAVPSLRAEMG